MNSRSIFWSRLLKTKHYQWKTFRTIADWTIIVYLIIPAILIFTFMYVSWWQETPAWIEPFPVIAVFFLLYILCWQGTIHTYVQEADKVFLIKKSDLFIGMKRLGYVASVMGGVRSILLSVIVLMPILLRHYMLTISAIAVIVIYFIALYTVLIIVKYYINMMEARWKVLLAYSGVFLLFSFLTNVIYYLWVAGRIEIVLLISSLMFAAAVFTAVRTLQNISYIEYEIKANEEQKLKNVQMIFTLSLDVEKPVISKRKKPLLFRKSKRIFRNRREKNGYTELFIKAFIRNYTHWSSYFQMISVGAAAMVIIPPLWIKALVLLAFLIMAHAWLSTIWDKIFMFNPLTKKYTEQDAYFSARKQTIMAFYLFAIILLFIIAGTSLFLLRYAVSLPFA